MVGGVGQPGYQLLTDPAKKPYMEMLGALMWLLEHLFTYILVSDV